MSESKTAHLQDIVDALDAPEPFATFLDRETGRVIETASPNSGYESEFEDLNLPDIEELQAALADDGKPRYLALPDSFDIHEWRIMMDFAQAQPSDEVRFKLTEALRGKGAFRRFQDRAQQLGVMQQWYDHRGRAHREIAIDWCQSHDIPWVEGRSDMTPLSDGAPDADA